MNITRRGLLGMFAAGAAAAVLPSGVIMPVRRIITEGWVIKADGRCVFNGLSAQTAATWAAALRATVVRGSALVRVTQILDAQQLAAGDVVHVALLQPGDELREAWVDTAEALLPGEGQGFRFRSADVTARLRRP